MPSWIVLIPSALVLICALVTRNVRISLGLGIVSASLIAAQGNPFDACYRIITAAHDALLSKSALTMFLFLMVLGALIAFLNTSGAVAAYAQRLSPYLKSRRSVHITSLALSHTLFVDDYLNNLTVGSIMRPLVDAYGIPRVKLAYLINALSSALCVLVPASSWIAMILGQLEAVGISEQASCATLVHTDPFGMYLHAIPFLFYPILSIIGAWYITLSGISFGRMRRHETATLPHATWLYDTGEMPLSLFVIPLLVFLGGMVTSLLYTGDWTWLGGSATIGVALQRGNSALSLLIGACAGFISAALYTFVRLPHRSYIAGVSIYGGYSLMKGSIMVLALAWTFGTLLQRDVQVGIYLTQILTAHVPLVVMPLLVFMLSTVISLSTGSAWGTIALVFPLAIPAAVFATCAQAGSPLLPFLAPTIAAVISGAVAGGHFSPLSDATIMASTSAGSSHIEHVETQALYSLPALLSSGCAFLIAGMQACSNNSALIPLSIGTILLLAGLIVSASWSRIKRYII